MPGKPPSGQDPQKPESPPPQGRDPEMAGRLRGRSLAHPGALLHRERGRCHPAYRRPGRSETRPVAPLGGPARSLTPCTQTCQSSVRLSAGPRGQRRREVGRRVGRSWPRPAVAPPRGRGRRTVRRRTCWSSLLANPCWRGRASGPR